MSGLFLTNLTNYKKDNKLDKTQPFKIPKLKLQAIKKSTEEKPISMEKDISNRSLETNINKKCDYKLKKRLLKKKTFIKFSPKHKNQTKELKPIDIESILGNQHKNMMDIKNEYFFQNNSLYMERDKLDDDVIKKRTKLNALNKTISNVI